MRVGRVELVEPDRLDLHYVLRVYNGLPVQLSVALGWEGSTNSTGTRAWTCILWVHGGVGKRLRKVRTHLTVYIWSNRGLKTVCPYCSLVQSTIGLSDANKIIESSVVHFLLDL